MVDAIFNAVDAFYYATAPFWNTLVLIIIALLLWTLVDTTRPPRW